MLPCKLACADSTRLKAFIGKISKITQSRDSIDLFSDDLKDALRKLRVASLQLADLYAIFDVNEIEDVGFAEKAIANIKRRYIGQHRSYYYHNILHSFSGGAKFFSDEFAREIKLKCNAISALDLTETSSLYQNADIHVKRSHLTAILSNFSDIKGLDGYSILAEESNIGIRIVRDGSPCVENQQLHSQDIHTGIDDVDAQIEFYDLLDCAQRNDKGFGGYGRFVARLRISDLNFLSDFGSSSHPLALNSSLMSRILHTWQTPQIHEFIKTSLGDDFSPGSEEKNRLESLFQGGVLNDDLSLFEIKANMHMR